VAVQGAGQRSFGAVGSHPDGVGDLLDLGVQADPVRGEVAGRDPGGDGRRGLVGVLQLQVGCRNRDGQRVDHLVAEVGGLAGDGTAQLEQRCVPGRLGRAGRGVGLPDPGGGGFPGRVGRLAVRVVGGGAGVEGVQGEPGAGVAEVVLDGLTRKPGPGGRAAANLGLGVGKARGWRWLSGRGMAGVRGRRRLRGCGKGLVVKRRLLRRPPAG
jgi:hypothetical protein